MLDRSHLDKMKGVLGYNLGQVEKDYIQHMFLLQMYKNIKDELVFKGGTCLQKIFGLDRFSEDLDFTISGCVDMEKNLDRSVRVLSRFGCQAEVTRIIEDDISITAKIRVRGPLYNGSEMSLCSLRLEASKREKILLAPVTKRISPIYEDLPFYSLSAMSIEEILAEKVRALLTRNKARDLYDLFYLAIKDVDVRVDVIEKKLEYYDMHLDRDALKKSIFDKKKIWKPELRPLTPQLPDFEEVEKVIIDSISKNID